LKNNVFEERRFCSKKDSGHEAGDRRHVHWDLWCVEKQKRLSICH